MLSTDDQIVLALRRITQAIDQYSRQLWRDAGLTAPQLATLREIIAGRNTSPMTLADALHVSQPTITGILGRLEQQGLIVRQRSQIDRRSIIAIPTKKGRNLALKAPPLLRDRFRSELSRLQQRQQNEMLATLQREARFVDLVQESLGGYSDAQVGAAARDVLKNCQSVLSRLFSIERLSTSDEGSRIEVARGYDPQRFHVVGNVAGEPPFSGTIVHAGWIATKCDLPTWSGQADSAKVIAPVEVEVGGNS